MGYLWACARRLATRGRRSAREAGLCRPEPVLSGAAGAGARTSQVPTLEEALEQIDAALEKADQFDESTGVQYLGTLGGWEAAEVVTVCASVIERLTAPGSSYRTYAESQLRQAKSTTIGNALALGGILRGLRSDLESGYLTSVSEQAHAEVFADLIEMAEHLLADRLIEPAAVTAGGALEAHLRALAEKNGVSTARAGKPKRPGLLNDDLSKKQAYSKAEQKQITAWQGVRNSAAHAEGGLSREQVALMCQGVRDFIARYPA